MLSRTSLRPLAAAVRRSGIRPIQVAEAWRGLGPSTHQTNRVAQLDTSRTQNLGVQR
jgi:hypothetical protein